MAPTTTDSKSEQQGQNKSPPMQQALVLQRVEPPVREGPAPVKEPEMVALQGGSFKMGSNEDRSEQPVHRVSIKPVLIGKYPVSGRRVARMRSCQGVYPYRAGRR